MTPEPVSAVLLPGPGAPGRYASLVANGVIRLKVATTSDLDRLPRYDVPSEVSPLDLLLTDREHDKR
ncbi:hypothetical protein GA0070558_10367 [Micromonospora haikouensis]|uniref:Uncharacterized protein n=1 Tax=Micromonospora haikouensis TaxID=686309 RepID=A0A1C4UD95_9ACTN|nr:hypothetical protein [Micromonospora haikouensis]SCE69653.1 hypothetical protein GA0070558_10367 [Micromonospora haikouensis]